MPAVTGREKENCGVGMSINLLKAKRPCKKEAISRHLFQMDKIQVLSTTDKGTSVDIITENSKVELAKSLSVSVGAEAKYMAFSASVNVDYESSYESSSEKAYTKLISKIAKIRYYLPDDTCKKYLNPSFKEDLYNDNMSPADFFDKYGTHYLRETGVGGVLTVNLIITKDKSESKESLSTTIRAGWGKMVSASSSSKQTEEIKKLFERTELNYVSDGGIELVGVDAETLFKEYPGWVRSIGNNSSSWEFSYLPNDTSLVKIWDLCDSKHAKRRTALKSYYEAEAAKMEAKLLNEDDYVTDFRIYNESKKANAYVTQKDYKRVEQDLNEGAKGNWIYINYRTMNKKDVDKKHLQPITNLLLVKSDKALTWSSKTLYDGAGKRATYYRYDSDLNKNAGGKYIYLCYTYSTIYEPLVAIDAYKDNQLPESKEWDTVTWDGTHAIADVNRGAGGRYIYILQKHKQ